MNKVEKGNCYQFDIPDESLNAEETQSVIDALLWDLKRTKMGETFTVDIAIGPHEGAEQMAWDEFVGSRVKFSRAVFEKSEEVTRQACVDFLREHFADMLTLPPPGLRRIK